MTTKDPKVWGKFFPTWIAANFLGLSIGWTVSFFAFLIAEDFGFPVDSGNRDQIDQASEAIRLAIFMFPTFLSISIAQWTVFRFRLNYMELWIPHTILGYSLIPLSIFLMTLLDYDLMPWIIEGINILFIAGGVTGFFQWLVLRKEIKNSIWWIVYLPITIYGFIYVIFFAPIGPIIIWTIISAITGYILNKQFKFV